jgi:uncharacterized protein YbjT (DUF2867 family)
MIRTLCLVVAVFAALPAIAAERVFVAGGTGRSGIEIVKALRAAGYDVTASTRDVEKAKQRFGDDITWVEANMHDVPAVMRAVAGADKVVSALGHGDFIGVEAPQFAQYLAVRNLIDAAKAAKAKQIVVMTSSTAGHRFDHRLEARFGMVLYWMTKAEDYLLASGLPYTIVGPGGLATEEMIGLRGLEPPPPEDWGVKIMPRSEYKFDFVSRQGVATVVVAALRDPKAQGKAVAVVWDRDKRKAALTGTFAAIPVEPASSVSYLTAGPPPSRRPGPVQLKR